MHTHVTMQVVGAAACALPGLAPEQTALLSSTAAVWSQAGAAHYAAGNTFLDATAARAMAAGLPMTAINFGPFRCLANCTCG
jgi:KR domain